MKSVVFCVVLSLHFVVGQIGSYCESDSGCGNDQSQICVTHHCTCRSHYVSNGKYCIKESRFGEECGFTEQCNDFRQICSNTSIGVQRCICNMYHKFDYEVSHCVPKPNITDLLQEQNDFEGHIDHKATTTFYGISIAGFAITFIGFSCFIAALIYCFRMHQSDKKLNSDVSALTKKFGDKIVNSSNRRTSTQNERNLKDAAVVPIIQDNMVLDLAL